MGQAENTQSKEELEARLSFFRDLGKAQAAMKNVKHDGQVGRMYSYVTTEGMITDCKSALSEFGFAIYTLCEKIRPGNANTSKTTAPDGATTENTGSSNIAHAQYLVVHRDGYSAKTTREIPICVSDRQDPDKATNASFTNMLGYFLRNLLMVPRMSKSDDIDARSGKGRQY